MSLFDHEFRAREHREPTDDERAARRHVRHWVRNYPDATEEECKAAMTREHEAGSILLTLTLLLVIVELVYFVRKLRHGELGDTDEE